jgi:L-aspartate oxidase
VTAAILDRMAADGAGSVSLDLRPVPLERFPTILARLAEAGIDPAVQMVPVAPAAHYLIGGVRTDLEGRTTLPGLLAVGESACTGLHGANRLASNSLSECFVFGSRAARAALEQTGRPADRFPVPVWRFTPPADETREAVWQLAGPVRDGDRLEELRGDPYPLAALVAASALLRTESRGVHRRTDFPRLDPGFDGTHVVIDGAGRPRLERWSPPDRAEVA